MTPKIEVPAKPALVGADGKPISVAKRIKASLIRQVDSRIVAGFRTLPRALRPRQANLVALRETKIGPLWPEAQKRYADERTLEHRAWRRRHNRAASRSRARNR